MEPVYSLLNLIHFHMKALTLTNFPMGDRRDINYHLIGVLSLLSQLETPVSLAADYSKYPRIVAGGTSNWPVYTPFSQLRRQNNTALPRLSRQLRRLQHSRLCSPGRSYSTYLWNDSWFQTFHKRKSIIHSTLQQMGALSQIYKGSFQYNPHFFCIRVYINLSVVYTRDSSQIC